MAIVPETRYSGKITPGNPSYPYGQARNITVPGDGTGTPFEEALVNDTFGFYQALLSLSGVVPSGSPETALVSQYYEAMQRLGVFKYDANVTYQPGEYVVTDAGAYRGVSVDNLANDPDADDGTNWDAIASAARDNAFTGANSFSQPVGVADATANGEAAALGQLIGHNQTWQDLLASRATDVEYTNNTGKTITVIVNTQSAGAGGAFSITLRIGGAVITSGGSDYSQRVTFLVPPGQTYEVSVTGLERWWELR